MVKMGVIGAGRWGINHLRAYSEISSEGGCTLVGLADINPEKEKLAKEYKIKFFYDYKKLLPLVDAVSVVAPTDLHYKIVKACLLAGKHVLVEKPITLKAEETKELVKIAKEKDLILSVGYLFRFNSAVRALKNEIKKIGDIQYITARYIHSTKPPRKDCGVIFNFAVHLIDILNFILEKKPKKVFCKKLNYLSKKREDCAFIILDYGNFIAELEVSWFHPLKKRDLWIIGSKKKIYTDLFEQIVKEYPISIDYEKVIHKKEISLEIHKNEPLKEELKHFCFCVKNRKRLNIGAEVYLTTKICELCLKSAKTGKEMPI